MSIVQPDSRSNIPAATWDEWREALAIALQGQYGGHHTWSRLDEIDRNAWRHDAANVMASLPDVPVDD